MSTTPEKLPGWKLIIFALGQLGLVARLLQRRVADHVLLHAARDRLGDAHLPALHLRGRRPGPLHGDRHHQFRRAPLRRRHEPPDRLLVGPLARQDGQAALLHGDQRRALRLLRLSRLPAAQAFLAVAQPRRELDQHRLALRDHPPLLFLLRDVLRALQRPHQRARPQPQGEAHHQHRDRGDLVPRASPRAISSTISRACSRRRA